MAEINVKNADFSKLTLSVMGKGLCMIQLKYLYLITLDMIQKNTTFLRARQVRRQKSNNK